MIQHERRREMGWGAVAVLPIAFGATGCSRSPSFNILGSFFPAWLLCMVAGIVLAGIASWVVGRYKLEKHLAWPIVVYPSLAAFFSFTLWLLFFS